jgi:uncharacterized protein (TIGR02145 family)
MRRNVMVLLSIVILVTTATSFAGDCGDVNSDGSVNILDIVYLINYKYKGAPAPICDAVTDIDGNVYRTVTIGTQVWMAENLRVLHYRNGDPIPHVTDGNEWSDLTTGACCPYNNTIIMPLIATYGRLYNWYAVNDSRNIAPEGWHVPSDAEWQTLADYLGGDAVAGGKMKEAGTTHWDSPNTGATNESGLTVLPGGDRDYNGTYDGMGFLAYFWSSTEVDSGNAWYRYLHCEVSNFGRHSYDKPTGFSVRCVKD